MNVKCMRSEEEIKTKPNKNRIQTGLHQGSSSSSATGEK